MRALTVVCVLWIGCSSGANQDAGASASDGASAVARDGGVDGARTEDASIPPILDGAAAVSDAASAVVDRTPQLEVDSAVTPADLAAPTDFAMMAPAPPDIAAIEGGSFTPPGSGDDVLAHASPTAISLTPLSGADNILDVSTDSGGGIWAVSALNVYYWPTASSAPHLYSSSDGLARGSSQNPFASVAGGNPGQAVVGNRGAIADVLFVGASTGALQSITNMVVPFSTSPEYPEHLVRVTSGIRVAIDRGGTFLGTAYVGGVHGFVAWHGLDGDCHCEQFQEHQHFIPSDAMNDCDSTQPPFGCWGGDVKGLGFSPEGDVWEGDEHFVSLLPQRSLGAFTDFFQPFALGIDVFPGANDEIAALAVDGAGGVWVASFGQGLAYLQPMTHLPTYFDRARELPQNRLTAVAVDTDGSVWVGTFEGGIARRRTDGTWIYYTDGSGLPSDEISSLWIDRASQPRRVVVGTHHGAGIYTGP